MHSERIFLVIPQVRDIRKLRLGETGPRVTEGISRGQSRFRLGNVGTYCTSTYVLHLFMSSHYKVALNIGLGRGISVAAVVSVFRSAIDPSRRSAPLS